MTLAREYTVIILSSMLAVGASYAYCLAKVHRAESASAQAELAYLRTWKRAHDKRLEEIISLEHDMAYWVWVIGEIEREREEDEGAAPRLAPPSLAPGREALNLAVLRSRVDASNLRGLLKAQGHGMVHAGGALGEDHRAYP